MKEYYVKWADAYMRYTKIEGEGVPILFIHGLGCASSYDYPEVIGADALKGYPCILVDLLGAGYSDKPEMFSYSVKDHTRYLYDFIQELGIRSCIIFGHSLGGAVAIELAALCGDRCKKLILSEANLDPSLAGATSFAIAKYEEEEFVTKGIKVLLEKSRREGNTMWAASLLNWLPSAAYRISKDAVIGGEPSWRSVIYGLGCDVYYIFGENSLPDTDEEVLKKNGIYVEVVPKAGHSMAWENPNGLARVIRGCL